MEFAKFTEGQVGSFAQKQHFNKNAVAAQCCLMTLLLTTALLS